GLTASIMEYEGLTKQLSNQEVKSQIISFKLDFPNELVQEKLMLDKHDPIYKIIRLRIVDGAPYILEHTIMNANLIPGINEEILHQSIYDYIQICLNKQLSNQEVKSQIISFKLDFPNELVQEKLMLDKHDPIYKIIRLRIVDGAPYILEHTIMNANLIPGINEEILHQSIYDYIHQELNLQFGGAHRIIQADKASEYDQKYLKCEEHDPILEIEQVVYLEDGTPFEYSRSRNKYNTRSYNVVDF